MSEMERIEWEEDEMQVAKCLGEMMIIEEMVEDNVEEDEWASAIIINTGHNFFT